MGPRNWLAHDRALPRDRRPVGLLVADRLLPGTLREISGAGAWIESPVRLDPGTAVTLRHPQVGTIRADVIGQDRAALQLRFDRSEGSVAFALAVIAADMRRGA